MITIPLLRYFSMAFLASAPLYVNAPFARADHEPVEPFDLFIEPPQHDELSPDARSRIDDPILLPDDLSPLDEAEERRRQREALEADARALEEAQRAAKNNELPTLSDDRAERLATLFAILQTTENETLAERARDEIQRTWSRSGSDTIDLLLGWAGAAMEKQEFGVALDYLDNIIRLKPDFAEGWNRRATVYFLQQDFAHSIADVERTLELEPRHFGALAGLGAMLRDLGDEERALFAYRQALAANPLMPQIKETIEELEKKVKGRDI